MRESTKCRRLGLHTFISRGCEEMLCTDRAKSAIAAKSPIISLFLLVTCTNGQ
ncbi:hypothetical protein [Azospirillum doebereinerae]